MSSQQQIPDSKTPSPALPATPRRAVCTALFIVTMGSAALAQQGAALKDVFDPDLADVKPTEALSQAVKQGQQGTGSGCYPPRLKIVVVTANPDRSFAESLGNARAAAMAAYLSAAGLPQDQFEVSSSLGSVEAVLATYGELRGDKDRDPPKFKELHSTPEKGTKVKAGDKINVKFVASERYEDGHKSWPTGVRAAQLRELKAGVLHVKEYGQKPDPCALAPFEWTYTVPADPPTVIKLIAHAEDGSGNVREEEAEFPTVDMWKATLHLRGEGNIYKDDADVRAQFTVEGSGDVVGKGTATITPAPRVFIESDKCTFMHTVTPNTFDIAVEGHRQSDELRLKIRPLSTATLAIQITGGPCRAGAGPALAGMSPFAGIQYHSVEFGVRARHGAENSGHETLPGGFTVDWQMRVECPTC
jgi:hypothetical protein